MFKEATKIRLEGFSILQSALYIMILPKHPKLPSRNENTRKWLQKI
jgi:hypothetical protein